MAAHLNFISVSDGSPESQDSRRRPEQRDPQGCGQAEAADVAQREAGVLPEPGRNRARQARAAPEAVAACQNHTVTTGWVCSLDGISQRHPCSHVLASSKQSHTLVCQSVHASAAIISWGKSECRNKQNPQTSKYHTCKMIVLECGIGCQGFWSEVERDKATDDAWQCQSSRGSSTGMCVPPCGSSSIVALPGCRMSSSASKGLTWGSWRVCSRPELWTEAVPDWEVPLWISCDI